MYTTDAELTPAERLHEIAAILAAGILRLRTRSGSTLESAALGEKSDPERISDSAQERLDLSGTQSPHVHAG
jgi:hypothetical protein